MELLVLFGLLCGEIRDVEPIWEPRTIHEIWVTKYYKPEEPCLFICEERADECNSAPELDDFTVCEVTLQECYQQCPKQEITKEEYDELGSQ